MSRKKIMIETVLTELAKAGGTELFYHRVKNY